MLSIKEKNYEDNIIDKEVFIYISVNLENWLFIGHPQTNENGKLVISLDNKIVRFIKICIKDKILYFNSIEILVDDSIMRFRDTFLYKSKKMHKKIIDAITSQTYEKNEIDIVLSNANNNDIILELGASIGAMSTVVKSNFKEILYYACKANPELIPLIKKNHQLNNISCHILHGAVGNGDFTEFYIHNECWASSIIPFPDPLRVDRIKVYNLKELIKIINPTFLIIDIEGAEYDIIDENTDFSPIKKICIEFHECGNAEKLFKIILNKGFTSMRPFPNKNKFVMYFYKS